MKDKICKTFNLVTLKSCLLFTLIFAVMLWLIDFSPVGVAGLLKVSNGVSILDYETRYSVDFAYDWLERMGEAGRNFHLTKIMPLDILFPPSFMLFMLSWLSLLTRQVTKEESVLRCIPALPVIYMLLDWFENIGITAMLYCYPVRLAAVCLTTGWITAVKKTVILCIIIIAAAEILILIFRKLKGATGAEIKG